MHQINIQCIIKNMKTRANIHLDADAYAFASSYASAKGIALGAAVGELLRRVEQFPEPSMDTSTRLKTGPRGYLVKAKTGKVVTPEMVREASEEDSA
jgi:hypothetical protein